MARRNARAGHRTEFLVARPSGVTMNDLAALQGKLQARKYFIVALSQAQPGNNLAHAEHPWIVQRRGNFVVGKFRRAAQPRVLWRHHRHQRVNPQWMFLDFIEKQFYAAQAEYARHLIAGRNHRRGAMRQKRLQILEGPGVMADMGMAVYKTGRDITS